jgi:glucose/arabinose dehydrogenase
MFLASGVGPNGAGDDTIIVVTPEGRISTSGFVRDPDLSPLDLLIAQNGNILVTSEHPFGALDAVTTVPEYDPHDGRLLRVLSANGQTEFRRPRGLRFAPDGKLYRVTRTKSLPSFL